jgi:hypothetical protein
MPAPKVDLLQHSRLKLGGLKVVPLRAGTDAKENPQGTDNGTVEGLDGTKRPADDSAIKPNCRNVAAEVVNDISMKSGYAQYMTRRRLTSLVATLFLLLAAAISLAQPVAVAATHIQHDAQVMSAIVDHGHVHPADLADHDPADHAHDVAYDATSVLLPVVSWPDAWTRQGSHEILSTDPGGYERPPRNSVAT